MKNISKYWVAAIVAVLVLIFLSTSTFKILQPGEKGIIFRPYTTGLDKMNVYEAGFQIISPFNTMFIYDVKEQQSEEKMDILDKSGLSLNVDVTIRFNPVFSRIGYLHEQFGIEYVNNLVKPELRSSVRKVMGRYTAEEIYSTKRKEVEESIISETKTILKNNDVDMRALLIRSITLPEQIKKAIESKLQQEQESLAYKFKLEKENSEAERKRIEAEGSAIANNIVNKSISENLLKMKGIEATLELAKSQNAKVIVIGSGKDGLPIILGNQ